jgi:hypothetical protein
LPAIRLAGQQVGSQEGWQARRLEGDQAISLAFHQASQWPLQCDWWFVINHTKFISRSATLVDGKLNKINTDDSDMAGCYEPVASSGTTLQNQIITSEHV